MHTPTFDQHSRQSRTLPDLASSSTALPPSCSPVKTCCFMSHNSWRHIISGLSIWKVSASDRQGWPRLEQLEGLRLRDLLEVNLAPPGRLRRRRILHRGCRRLFCPAVGVLRHFHCVQATQRYALLQEDAGSTGQVTLLRRQLQSVPLVLPTSPFKVELSNVCHGTASLSRARSAGTWPARVGTALATGSRGTVPGSTQAQGTHRPVVPHCWLPCLLRRTTRAPARNALRADQKARSPLLAWRGRLCCRMVTCEAPLRLKH